MFLSSPWQMSSPWNRLWGIGWERCLTGSCVLRNSSLGSLGINPQLILGREGWLGCGCPHQHFPNPSVWVRADSSQRAHTSPAGSSWRKARVELGVVSLSRHCQSLQGHSWVSFSRRTKAFDSHCGFPCHVLSPASLRAGSPVPHRCPSPGCFSAPMLAARPGAHRPAPRSFGLWSKRRWKHPLIPRRQLRRCKIGTNGSGEAVAVSSDLSAGSERGAGVAGGAEGKIRAQVPAPCPCTTTALPRGCCQPRRLVKPFPCRLWEPRSSKSGTWPLIASSASTPAAKGTETSARVPVPLAGGVCSWQAALARPRGCSRGDVPQVTSSSCPAILACSQHPYRELQHPMASGQSRSWPRSPGG